MARPPRLDLPGVPQHVIQRGNNRAACFFGDADRRFYLKCLAEAAARRGCAVHAYVLMSNHVHLLTTPTERGAVAAMLQDLGRRYVRIINTIHGRTGTLWEGRYRSSLVDSERYLLICHRYIELNPVRAGMVSDPMEYSGPATPTTRELGPASSSPNTPSSLALVRPTSNAAVNTGHCVRCPLRPACWSAFDRRSTPTPPWVPNLSSIMQRKSWEDQCDRRGGAVRPKLLQENCSDPFYRGFRVPSSVGISSVTVGWMCMARWMVV